MTTYVHLVLYLAEFLLEQEMFQTKILVKFKTQILCSTIFLSFFLSFSLPGKSCHLWGNVEKYSIAEQATDDALRALNAVAQLVGALCYKPEGRGFDSRWCHWPHCGHGVDSASNRNISWILRAANA